MADGVPELPGVSTPQRAPTTLRRNSGKRRWLAFSGGALAIVATIVAIVRPDWPTWLSPPGTGNVDTAVAALVEAVGTERHVEGRLAGGFRHGPYRSPNRSARVTIVENLRLLSAAGFLQKAAGDDPNSSNVHAHGVAELLLGRYDEAIRLLESAARQSPENGRFQSDLCVAYLARARTSDRAEDWPRALAAGVHAVGLEPELQEAWFNRALAISALNLPLEAERAWGEYLERDQHPQWRAEAVERLNALREPAPGSTWSADREQILQLSLAADPSRLGPYLNLYAQPLRQLAEDELLTAWGDHYSKGDASSVAFLTQARTLAAVFQETNRDVLLAEAVSSIDALIGANPAQAARIARGLSLYGAARRLYEANRVVEAEPTFRESAGLLAESSNPIALWCHLHLAIVDYYKGRISEARRSVETIVTVATARSYRSLEARGLWMVGLIATLQARYADQLQAHEHALTLFEQLNEHDNVAAVHNLVAGGYQFLGDSRRMWFHMLSGLTGLGPLSSPRRRHTQLVSIASRATKWGLPEVTLVFAEEALAQAPQWGAPEAFVEAEQYRARAFAALGRPQEALSAASAARQGVADVPDPLIKNRLAAEVATMEAEVLGAIDPGRALASADDALEYFTRSALFLRVPRLYLARGRAQLAIGDMRAAAESFKAGVKHLEAERDQVPRHDFTRISHFDEVWSVYRELFTVVMASGASDSELLDIAERGRSRSLTEQRPIQPGGDWPRRLAESVGPRQAVLYYVQLENQTIVWFVTAARIRRYQLPLSRAIVTRAIEKVETALGAGERERAWRSDVEWLYDVLVKPLDLGSNDLETIVVVPDGSLTRLAFAALRDQQRGRYLIEDYALAIAPSAVFVSPARTRVFPKESTIVLAVANGRAVEDEGLAALPSTARELRAVRSSFPNTMVLENDDATPERTRALIGRAGAFHFAGHAVGNREYPELSRLLFSDGRMGTTAVLAADLRSFTLRGVSLVVLSSCSGLDGPLSSSEGLLGLARAFLREGVSEVVAARWNVADDASAAFMERFYTYLASDQPAATALARAARDSLRRNRETGDWAAWTLVGGDRPRGRI